MNDRGAGEEAKTAAQTTTMMLFVPMPWWWPLQVDLQEVELAVVVVVSMVAIDGGTGAQ